MATKDERIAEIQPRPFTGEEENCECCVSGPTTKNWQKDGAPRSGIPARIFLVKTRTSVKANSKVTDLKKALGATDQGPARNSPEKSADKTPPQDKRKEFSTADRRWSQQEVSQKSEAMKPACPWCCRPCIATEPLYPLAGVDENGRRRVMWLCDLCYRELCSEGRAAGDASC